MSGYDAPILPYEEVVRQTTVVLSPLNCESMYMLMRPTSQLLSTVILTGSIVVAGCTFAQKGRPMGMISQDKALTLARKDAMKNGIDAKDLDTMVLEIKMDDNGYQFVWIPMNPYQGGHECIVDVDRTGDKVTTQINPLAPIPAE